MTKTQSVGAGDNGSAVTSHWTFVTSVEQRSGQAMHVCHLLVWLLHLLVCDTIAVAAVSCLQHQCSNVTSVPSLFSMFFCSTEHLVTRGMQVWQETALSTSCWLKWVASRHSNFGHH